KSTTLGLPLGRAHHQAVELRRHLDLAGQARVRLHVVAEVEHVLLHRRRLAHRLAPCCIDMHVAGGTGASAAAFRPDAGKAVLDRRLHHGRAELALDRAGGAFMIDIGDFRHTIGGTMQDDAAALASYSGWRARTPDDDRQRSADMRPSLTAAITSSTTSMAAPLGVRGARRAMAGAPRGAPRARTGGGRPARGTPPPLA